MTMKHPSFSGDHSELEPRLPIPNRIVKRLSADDSAHAGVKVGHCQIIIPKTPSGLCYWGFLLYEKSKRPASASVPSI